MFSNVIHRTTSVAKHIFCLIQMETHFIFFVITSHAFTSIVLASHTDRHNSEQHPPKSTIYTKAFNYNTAVRRIAAISSTYFAFNFFDHPQNTLYRSYLRSRSTAFCRRTTRRKKRVSRRACHFRIITSQYHSSHDVTRFGRRDTHTHTLHGMDGAQRQCERCFKPDTQHNIFIQHDTIQVASAV